MQQKFSRVLEFFARHFSAVVCKCASGDRLFLILFFTIKKIFTILLSHCHRNMRELSNTKGFLPRDNGQDNAKTMALCLTKALKFYDIFNCFVQTFRCFLYIFSLTNLTDSPWLLNFWQGIFRPVTSVPLSILPDRQNQVCSSQHGNGKSAVCGITASRVTVSPALCVACPHPPFLFFGCRRGPPHLLVSLGIPRRVSVRRRWPHPGARCPRFRNILPLCPRMAVFFVRIIVIIRTNYDQIANSQ